MNGVQSNRQAAEHNRRAWDRLAGQGHRFARPASDDDLHRSLERLDADNWLGADIRGKRVLCLAAGGGRHGPLYAAAGADVTVADISAAQLELDRDVARQRRIAIRTVTTSMDDLSMFGTGEFDCIIHPVSTCYLPDVAAVYGQVARVTAPLGLYISQHKQPASLQATGELAAGGYRLLEPYYRSGPLPEVSVSLVREPGTQEFLHRWEELLGEMCRAGFWIEDVVEPRHGRPDAAQDTFGHRSMFLPPYVRVKARRRGQATQLVIG